MRNAYLMMWFALMPLVGVQAQEEPALRAGDMEVTHRSVKREGKTLRVTMDLSLSEAQVESKRAVLLTPRVTKGDRFRELPSVGIYGRDRYYHYLRQNGEDMLGGPGETVVRASQMPDTQRYEATIPYEPWMEGASVSLLRQDYGCCNDVEAERETVLVRQFSSVYQPVYLYERPEAEAVKQRALSGTAYVNFPVSKTVIRADYMDNRRELDKIIATIDSVKGDSDITITAISIKGFASPEGGYANNERLAKGRTQALKDYVSRLYRFEDDFIRATYEAENWEELRQWVANSNMREKAGILRLIDGKGAPDSKERRLRQAYPEAYRWLLAECYPSLRRSDYRVEYVIRQYSSPEEMREVLRTKPSKLSLQEIFIAAESMEQGSREYDEAFETAARMYPDDPVANLNAANSAMKRGDLEGAHRYLDKAGDSPKALYAKGVLAGHEGKYAEANQLLSQAKAAGVAEAEAEMAKLRELAY